MNRILFRSLYMFVCLVSIGALSGCAHYEKNSGRGDIPGFFIRSEMQQADRAVESARQAGKDKACPADFKAAEAAKDKAYDVFRACHTEEGAALANEATAKANALCPPQAAPMAASEAPIEPVPATEPTPERFKYCVTLDIEYDINKAEIRPQYGDEVAKVGDFMKKYPTTTAVIEGYTDEVGTDEYNLQLSQKRAASVVTYLEEHFGIAASRLAAKGYGKTRPIADNATDTGRQKNRRINAIIDCAFDLKEIAPPPDRLCIALNVEFATDSAEIRPAYFEQVDKVGTFMQKYPTTTAVIEGHTDSTGPAAHNIQLSRERAQSVVNYLATKFGIDTKRLSAKGYGSTRRIAYDGTPEGRQKNRRINAIIDCVIK